MDYQQLVPIWENYLKNKISDDYTTMYIHFPFCTQKCSFCMYDTIKWLPQHSENFLYEIEQQFKIASPIFKDEIIKAFYIGGGSPSLLNANQLSKLFILVEKYFTIDPVDNMFNIEMHAAHLTNDKIEILASSFINRVSIGVQSLNEEVLRMNNRIWASKDKVIEVFNKLHSYINNINIDLMHGLAGQTNKQIIEDIRVLSELKVPKITIYGYRNSMCFALRDGKIDNEGLKTRNISNTEEYHQSVIKDAQEIKIHLPKEYSWYGTKDEFSEYNYLLHKGEELKFKHTYVPEPIHFNNIISFGLGAYDSYFIPINHYVHINWFNDTINIFNFKDPEFKKIVKSTGINIDEYLKWLYNNREHNDYNNFLEKRLEFS